MKIVSVLFILLFGLSPARAQAPDAAELQSLRQTALRHYRGGHYSEAIHIYEKLATYQSSNLEAQKDLMRMLWNVGRYEEGVRTAQDVLERSPGDTEALALTKNSSAIIHREEILRLRDEGTRAYREGSYDTAVEKFTRAIQLDPSDPYVQRDLMWVLVFQKRYAEAAQVARAILRLRPENPEATRVLALDLVMRRLKTEEERQKAGRQILSEAGPLSESSRSDTLIPLYLELVTLSPNYAPYYHRLISALRREGRNEEAKMYIERLRSRFPQDADTWYWIGVMQMDQEAFVEARASFERALRAGKPKANLELALGRLATIDRDFKRALAYLESSRQKNPAQAALYPLLGRSYFWDQQYAKSVEAWDVALRHFPHNLDYHYQAALSLFYAGMRNEAREKLRKLAFRDAHRPSLGFLVDDAVVDGRPLEAIHLLEQSLSPLREEDVAWAVRLVDLYKEYGPQEKRGDWIDEILRIVPDHQPLLLLKAQIRADKRRTREARALFRKVFSTNPHNLWALHGMADCEAALGNASAAIDWAQKLRQEDPTSPKWLLVEADIRFSVGQRLAARKLLDEWLKDNEQAASVPILLYHGLTPIGKDPLLAYPYHMSVLTFEDQMKSLRENGYTALTVRELVEWLHGTRTIPEKSVLIAFDDARTDGLRAGLRLFQKYNLRGAMFVPLANVERARPPGYASWRELAKSASSGYWEIQSHGDEAHERVLVSTSGLRGLFLVNREYIPRLNLRETPEEWKSRIAADYESSYASIAKHVQTPPVGYAFPEGVYGQTGFSNTPEAAPVNLELVRKRYQAAFTQDTHGINLATRDPYFLKRVEPSPTLSGEGLLAHFRDHHPVSRAYAAQLDWAVEDELYPEAQGWLSKLKNRGVSPSIHLRKEAKIFAAMGDYARARRLAQDALAYEPSLRQHSDLASVFDRERFSSETNFLFSEDSSDRQYWIFDQALVAPFYKGTHWAALYRHGEYLQTQVPTAVENAAGARVDIELPRAHHIRLQSLWHLLSGPGRDTYSAELRWSKRWSRQVDTTLRLDRSLYGTAKAINDNILQERIRLDTVWTPRDDWRLRFYGAQGFLTDDNRRDTFRFETSFNLIKRVHWFGPVYQFTYDHMRRTDNRYYTPQELVQNSLGVELKTPLAWGWDWRARYLPGYATERGRDGEWVHSAETGLSRRIGRHTTVEATGFYYSNPGYRENGVRVSLFHRF